MASFEWKGRDRGGRAQSGVLVADNKEAVFAVLRRQQIVPMALDVAALPYLNCRALGTMLPNNWLLLEQGDDGLDGPPE